VSDGGATAGAAKKKKKKKNKKKKAASDGTKIEVAKKGDRVQGVALGFTQTHLMEGPFSVHMQKQTEPPTVTMDKLFPDLVFPQGQIMDHPLDWYQHSLQYSVDFQYSYLKC
jgi:hypothetical protein